MFLTTFLAFLNSVESTIKIHKFTSVAKSPKWPLSSEIWKLISGLIMIYVMYFPFLGGINHTVHFKQYFTPNILWLFMCGVCMSIWRAEVNPNCHSSDANSLKPPSRSGQLTSSPPCFHLLSYMCTHVYRHDWPFLCRSLDSNSGLHVCKIDL